MAMDKISQKDIDWLLNLNPKDPVQASAPPSTKRKRVGLRFLLATFLVIGGIILPFFVLIRTSVFLNLQHDVNGWLALGGGIGATILLLLFYLLVFFRKVQNKKLLLKFSLMGIATLVLSFSFYGLMYLSTVHAKSDEIQQVYRSMHPILRVAVATTTLADGDLVITDIQREPEDYRAMGLPINQQSLHFKQASTGYVHAVDLRTIGNSEFRNHVLQFSFELMGMYTLRHTGTADHLHVALPAP